MIISIEKLKMQADCGTLPDEVIKDRLDAIEAVIRAYTNNKFQNRAVRFIGESDGSSVSGYAVHFKAGDTVEISDSGINDGLYVVESADEGTMMLDRLIFPASGMLFTKIEYPADVRQCAVDLFNWKTANGDKVGLKSETISRHSVTFEDSSALFMGYPVGILSGLKLYRKARC